MRSTPDAAWRTAWARLPAERGDHDVLGVGTLDQVGRGRAERAGDQGGAVGEGDVEQWFVALGRHREPTADLQAFLLGRDRDVVATEEIIEELLVLDGEQRIEGDVETAGLGADVLRWQQQVDAVRLVTDLVLDPAELGLEHAGRVPDRPQDAQPSGLRDGGDHVAAMAERQDRELDAEHLGDSRAHVADGTGTARPVAADRPLWKSVPERLGSTGKSLDGVGTQSARSRTVSGC